MNTHKHPYKNSEFAGQKPGNYAVEALACDEVTSSMMTSDTFREDFLS